MHNHWQLIKHYNMNVYVPKDKFVNTSYIISEFKKHKYNIVDDWESANIIFNPFTKKIPSWLKNKEIYSFPNHNLCTIKSNLPSTIANLFGEERKNIIIPVTYPVIATSNSIDDAVKKIKIANDASKLMYIVKPANLFGGYKINVLPLPKIKEYILKTAKDKDSEWVIQEYLHPPLLIKHSTFNYYCKFDLRVNLFMCTNRITKNIEIYKYSDILLRISDEEYSLENKNILAHVTNLDLREEISDNSSKILSEVPELQGYVSPVNIFLKKYIYPLVAATYTQPNKNNNNYFQRYGIDLMIMKNGTIKLLEINNNPGQSLNNEIANSAINYAMNRKLPKKFELINPKYYKNVCFNNILDLPNNHSKFITQNNNFYFTIAIDKSPIDNARHNFLYSDLAVKKYDAKNCKFLLISSGCKILSIRPIVHLFTYNKSDNWELFKKQIIKHKELIDKVKILRTKNNEYTNYWQIIAVQNDNVFLVQNWPERIMDKARVVARCDQGSALDPRHG